jgi:hypothetical protein
LNGSISNAAEPHAVLSFEMYSAIEEGLMNGEIKELYAKLAALESEAEKMRLASIVVGRGYSEAQRSLKELTVVSLDTARRAAAAVDNALLATKRAASTAKEAAPHSAFGAARLAAQAASAASAAAVEAAAAAHAAALAAVQAAEHESEKSAFELAREIAAKARAEARRAMEAAKEAVRVSQAVVEYADALGH